MRSDRERRFPLFVNLSGRRILVVGAGSIAARRVKILLEFGPEITVVAPRVSEEIEELASQEALTLVKRGYRQEDLSGVFLVLAATDDHSLNRKIYDSCRAAGIPVNVCNRKELCDFYFPSVVQKGDITVGISASGHDHGGTRAARIAIEQCLEGERLYD